MTVLAIGSQNQALEPPYKPTSATGLEGADDTEDVPASSIHDDSTTTDVPANYVSDAELLAWLQAKSTGQYGELDQLMDASNARSKLVKDLSTLKEKLAKASENPSAALAEIETLRAEYAGTEHAEEIEKLLGPIRTTIEQHMTAIASVEAQDWDEEVKKGLRAEIEGGLAGHIRGFSGSVDATIKDLEHDDQLALVQIQALMSEIRETAQLTSNIIANRSQTSDSIVGNLRG
jgi:hypothetical protein